MKVLLIFLGRRGGLASYSYEIGKALAKKTEVVSVVSAQAENLSDWKALNNKVYSISTYTNKISLLLSFLNWTKFYHLYKIIKSEKPDVIYCPGFHFWLPIVYVLFPSVPKVFTLHDPVLHSGEKKLSIQLLQSWLLKRSTRVIVLSSVFKNLVGSIIGRPDDVDVIPHGAIDFCQNNYVKTKSSSALTLLFIGRILPYKGLDILLKAFPLIKKRMPETRLLIAGDGYIDKELSNQDGVVVINQWLNESKICELFQQSDVLVFPYLDATQSGIIPTAAFYGLPVVASRVGGLVEQVIDGKTGLLVKAGNVEELAKACIRLLENSNERVQMGATAQVWALDVLSWNSIADKLLSGFKKNITS